MKNSQKSSLHLLIQNRETGDIDAIIKNREQYDYWFNYLLEMNDIKIAMKVFAEELGITEESIKKQWTLPEIMNVMSTRYKCIDIIHLKGSEK